MPYPSQFSRVGYGALSDTPIDSPTEQKMSQLRLLYTNLPAYYPSITPLDQRLIPEMPIGQSPTNSGDSSPLATDSNTRRSHSEPPPRWGGLPHVGRGQETQVHVNGEVGAASAATNSSSVRQGENGDKRPMQGGMWSEIGFLLSGKENENGENATPSNHHTGDSPGKEEIQLDEADSSFSKPAVSTERGAAAIPANVVPRATSTRRQIPRLLNSNSQPNDKTVGGEVQHAASPASTTAATSPTGQQHLAHHDELAIRSPSSVNASGKPGKSAKQIYPFLRIPPIPQKDVLEDGLPPRRRTTAIPTEQSRDLWVIVKAADNLPSPAQVGLGGGRNGSKVCWGRLRYEDAVHTTPERDWEDRCAWQSAMELRMVESFLTSPSGLRKSGNIANKSRYVTFELFLSDPGGSHAQSIGSARYDFAALLVSGQRQEVRTEVIVDEQGNTVHGANGGECSVSLTLKVLRIHKSFKWRPPEPEEDRLGGRMDTIVRRSSEGQNQRRSSSGISLNTSGNGSPAKLQRTKTFWNRTAGTTTHSPEDEQEEEEEEEDDDDEEEPLLDDGLSKDYFWRQRLEQVMESLTVNLIVMFLVVVDVVNIVVWIIIGEDEETGLRNAVTVIVVASFIIELSLRQLAQGRRFWWNVWNIFDFIVVWASVVITIALLSVNSDDLDNAKATASTLRVVSRIAMGLRVARVVINIRRARALSGSVTKNLRSAVSQNKRRYKRHGFDLDLTYITDRIMAMSAPAFGGHTAYRNDINLVSRFLSFRHYGRFFVYNLCDTYVSSDGVMGNYHPQMLFNQVQRVPFEDHAPPLLSELVYLCEEATGFLANHDRNVVAVHCKGGKGRTGVVVAAILLWSGHRRCAMDALELFTFRRTANFIPGQGVDGSSEPLQGAEKHTRKNFNQGVEGPSQIRYVQYIEAMLYCGVDYLDNRRIFLAAIEIPIPPQAAENPWQLSVSIRSMRSTLFDTTTDAKTPTVISLTGHPKEVFAIPVEMILWGDIRIDFFRHLPRQQRKLDFWVMFHTAFLEPDSIVNYKKKDIDMLHKDLDDHRCPKDFSITFRFDSHHSASAQRKFPESSFERLPSDKSSDGSQVVAADRNRQPPTPRPDENRISIARAPQVTTDWGKAVPGQTGAALSSSDRANECDLGAAHIDSFDAPVVFRNIFQKIATPISRSKGDPLVRSWDAECGLVLITSGAAEAVVELADTVREHSPQMHHPLAFQAPKGVDPPHTRVPCVCVVGRNQLLGASTFLSGLPGMPYRVRSEKLEGFIIQGGRTTTDGGEGEGGMMIGQSDFMQGDMDMLSSLSWGEKEAFFRGMAVTLAARFSRVFMEAVRIGRLKAMNDKQSVLQNLDETELICKQCIRQFSLPIHESLSSTAMCVVGGDGTVSGQVRLILLKRHFVLDHDVFGPSISPNATMVRADQLMEVSWAEEGRKCSTLRLTIRYTTSRRASTTVGRSNSIIGNMLDSLNRKDSEAPQDEGAGHKEHDAEAGHGHRLSAGVLAPPRLTHKTHQTLLTFQNRLRARHALGSLQVLREMGGELRAVESLRPLDVPLLQPLLEQCSKRHNLKKGETLQQATLTDSLFIVKDGEVRLRKKGEVYRIVRAGALFGLTEFVQETPNGDYEASASEQSVVIELVRTQVQSFIANDREVGTVLYHTVCQLIDKEVYTLLRETFPGAWSKRATTTTSTAQSRQPVLGQREKSGVV